MRVAENINLRHLEKKLSMRAGFLNPRCPSVFINEDSDTSAWNFKANFIQIGVKTILEKDPGNLEKLSTLLLAHEVSHTLNTDTGVLEKIDFPFPILNILEDERIERMMEERGYNFYELHDFSYMFFYWEKPLGKLIPMLRNPYNIGVLLRWRRWGVETKTKKPDVLTEKEYEEFLADWEKAIDSSISATSTEEVAKIGKSLYEKWKKVFGEKAPENTVTGIEGKEEDFGRKEKDEEEGEAHGRDELGRPPEECTPSSDFMSSRPVHRWDKKWINRTLSELKRYLKLPSYMETEYRMTGRRINPKRAENFLPPFKRNDSIALSLEKKKLLIVIDNSGSMSGEPRYWADHTAYVLAKLFNAHIVMTCTGSEKPIWVEKLDDLRFIRAQGTENYRSLGDLPMRYDFTLFLTDACVDEADWEFAKKLSRLCKVGAGYVNTVKDSYIENALKEVFSKYFYTKPDRVAVEVGLFLKRLFLGRA